MLTNFLIHCDKSTWLSSKITFIIWNFEKSIVYTHHSIHQILHVSFEYVYNCQIGRHGCAFSAVVVVFVVVVVVAVVVVITATLLPPSCSFIIGVSLFCIVYIIVVVFVVVAVFLTFFFSFCQRTHIWNLKKIVFITK